MKHFLSFTFSLLVTANVFSQFVDTVTNFTFENSNPIPSTRNVSGYSGCLLTTTTIQEWLPDSSSWRNVSLTTNHYNANSQVDTSVTQLWDTSSNTWINSSRLSYSYNANNQVSQLLFEFWDPLSLNWTGVNRTTNIYNGSNLLDSSITEMNVLGTWQNLSLTVNEYNANNHIDTTTLQKWVLVNWVDSSRSFYTYNADATVKQTINQTSDGLTWTNWYRNTYKYSGTKLLLNDTAQNWIVDHWNDTALTTNTYSGSGVLATTLQSTSNDNGANWVFSTRTNFTHNGPGGAISESISQIFDITQNSWVDNTEITYHYTDCTLPITLLDFSAFLNGKVAQLQWTTSTEVNTKDFVVQRSIDGTHFKSIGTVNAMGNSTRRTLYQFPDAGALSTGANKLYYRLQMVDKDNRFAYSRIATVKIINDKLFVIYPNPAKGYLIITSNATLSNAQIKIIDQNGKVLYQQQVASLFAGTSNKINVSNLNKGIYYLQVITVNGAQTTKFLKY